MRLPDPPDRYSPDLARETNRALESEDSRNLKRGRDIEMQDGRVILKSPNGTRYAITVDNAGALSTTAV